MLQAKGKTFSLDSRLKLLYEISLAMNWLSQNYVCHRDLKPENIMIDMNGCPKLIDFGSCCSHFGRDLLTVKTTKCTSETI